MTVARRRSAGSRSAALLLIVALVIISVPAFSQRRDEGQEACTSASFGVGADRVTAHFDCVPVGDLVGAQVVGGRAFLYATEVDPDLNPPPLLWTDSVIELSRAALEIGGRYHFALGPQPSSGRKLRRGEVGDLVLLKNILETRSHPVVALVRARLAPLLEVIGPATAVDPRTEARLQSQVTEALNSILDEDLASLGSAADLSHTTRHIVSREPKDSLLVRRSILEDLLFPMIAGDMEDSYAIHWVHEEERMDDFRLETLFSGGRTESAFLAADALLKLMSSGQDVPSSLVFGPTLFNLCAREMMTEVRRGKPFTFEGWGVFFDLAMRPKSADLPGQNIWVGGAENDRALVVRSRSESGFSCVTRFADSLTGYLPRLLAAEGPVGDRLRNLKVAMVSGYLIDWLVDHVPVDGGFLRSLTTKPVSNVPPQVHIMPIRFTAGSRAFGVGVFGGVQAGNASSGEPFPAPTGSPARSPSPRSSPPLEISRAEVDGKTLMRIDLSRILGLQANGMN